MWSTFLKSQQFARELVGDVTFDYEVDNSRARLFKKRNIKQFLAYSERKLKSTMKAPVTVNPPLAEFSNLHSSATSRYDNRIDEKLSSLNNGNLESISSQAGYQNAHAIRSSDLQKGPDAHTPKIEIVNMNSATSAKGAQLLADHEVVLKDSNIVTSSTLFSYTPQRQSFRRRLHKVHEQQHALLELDLTHIRKKLNFKETLDTVQNTPPEHLKRDALECQCHIAIWDNREGFVRPEPIFKRSTFCHLSIDDPGAVDKLVYIELDSTFEIMAAELRVPLQVNDNTKMIIGDNYFLEVKIMPCSTGIKWPPFPILSKSEADLYHASRSVSAHSVQGALVARYHHLPTAPAPEIPLSVWYVDDGILYKTKYGLAVSAEWTNPSPLEAQVRADALSKPPVIPSWLTGFGFEPESAGTSAKQDKRTISKPGNSHWHNEVTISYIFDAGNSSSTTPALRTATLRGFACPICRSQELETWIELQFHLVTQHHKFNFEIRRQILDENTGGVRLATIAVSHAAPPRPRELVRNPKEIYWETSGNRFDLKKYLEESRKVAGKMTMVQAKKPLPKVPPHPLTELRQKHDGCLPVEHVLAIPERSRRRFPIVETRTKNKLAIFTSISHRQLRPSEEPLSESDDDMDINWIKEKQEQRIENRDDLRHDDKEFQKRWNRHRLDEGLCHSRYLSDSVVRFVRKHQVWLSDPKAMAKLQDLLEILKSRYLVTDEVISGCHQIVLDASQDIGTSLQELIKVANDPSLGTVSSSKNDPPLATALGVSSVVDTAWEESSMVSTTVRDSSAVSTAMEESSVGVLRKQNGVEASTRNETSRASKTFTTQPATRNELTNMNQPFISAESLAAVQYCAVDELVAIKQHTVAEKKAAANNRTSPKNDSDVEVIDESDFNPRVKKDGKVHGHLAFPKPLPSTLACDTNKADEKFSASPSQERGQHGQVTKKRKAPESPILGSRQFGRPSTITQGHKMTQSEQVAKLPNTDKQGREPNGRFSKKPKVLKDHTSEPRNRPRQSDFPRSHNSSLDLELITQASQICHHPMTSTSSSIAPINFALHSPCFATAQPACSSSTTVAYTLFPRCGLCDRSISVIDSKTIACSNRLSHLKPPFKSRCRAPRFQYHIACIQSTFHWVDNMDDTKWRCPVCYATEFTADMSGAADNTNRHKEQIQNLAQQVRGLYVQALGGAKDSRESAGEREKGTVKMVPASVEYVDLTGDGA